MKQTKHHQEEEVPKQPHKFEDAIGPPKTLFSGLSTAHTSSPPPKPPRHCEDHLRDVRTAETAERTATVKVGVGRVGLHRKEGGNGLMPKGLLCQQLLG